MTYLKTIVLVTAFFWMASSSFAVDENNSPKQVIAEWASTFNKNDSKAIVDFYEQSEDIELIMSAGIYKHGYLAIERTYKDDFKAVRFYDSKAKKMSVREIGDTALVTFEHQFKSEIKKDGSRWRVHIRTSSILGRKNGQWKIVLEHSSPINGIERYVEIK